MQPSKITRFIRDIYSTAEFIPLHAPTFNGNEKKYVAETIESTFVSSVGSFVDEFENKIENFTGCAKAVATVNGTAALHTALYMSGVSRGDLVITQALTFVATCNVLYHMGVEPLFCDISMTSLGLCPKAVDEYLTDHAYLKNTNCYHKNTHQIIKAIIPMHTFGHPVELDELIKVCNKWNLTLIEDAAESLGSFYKNRHTGTFGIFSALSFNGNKIITTGGGGMVLCSSIEQGNKTKHITTTAKAPHSYEFYHDEAGFNYRLPNINAALGCAQIESLPIFLEQKRQLAETYKKFFSNTEFQFFSEPSYAKSNYWLNAIICSDKGHRDTLLKETNKNGVMTRPVWKLMHRLPMFSNTMRSDLTNSEYIEARLVNLPSSPSRRT